MSDKNNPFSLIDKTIIVTGASSGIGRQCAISLSQLGAKVILLGRDTKRLEETWSLMDKIQTLINPYHASLIRTPSKKKRKCIKCPRIFTSVGPGNRRCSKCEGHVAHVRVNHYKV